MEIDQGIGKWKIVGYIIGCIGILVNITSDYFFVNIYMNYLLGRCRNEIKILINLTEIYSKQILFSNFGF